MWGLLQLAFMEMWGEEARHQESECVLRPHSENIHTLQYIYLDTKLLEPVVYFFEPVKTSLWAVWTEQHPQYT